MSRKNTGYYLPPILLSSFLLLFSAAVATARTLDVGAGYPYANVRLAAQAAAPGDTLLVHGAETAGSLVIGDLHGAQDAWITIMAALGDSPRVVPEPGASSSGWQFAEATYLRIVGITFSGHTANGLNIDDGGTYDTPTHNILVQNCVFIGDPGNSANSDLLKLSGVDSFRVEGCSFTNGAQGGSGIDMVGCHNGVIVGNTFQNLGASGIQAKGGTQFVRVDRCRFVDAGARAINIGGSTGLEFFRPIDAPFEAADIQVYACLFTGSQAPIAFPGSVRCSVVNNTFYRPGRWVLRILQETVDATRFAESGENSFVNNIVVVDNALATAVNIGPDTRPETYTFSNNMWYNIDSPAWAPGLPVQETNGVTGEDPMLANPAIGDFHISITSPAFGYGADAPQPERDYYGNAYNTPRSIGGAEWMPPVSGVGVPAMHAGGLAATLYPNPATSAVQLYYQLAMPAIATITVFNATGQQLAKYPVAMQEAGQQIATLDITNYPGGIYLVRVQAGESVAVVRVVKSEYVR